MSVVYFVRSGDAGSIKIGVATNLQKRLQTFRNGNPAPMLVLASVPGLHADEKRIHRLFGPLRTVREWFSPEQPLLAFIAALNDGVTEQHDPLLAACPF